MHEWYGSAELGMNKGLKMSARKVALGVTDIETDLFNQGWLLKKPRPGPADNQIFATNEDEFGCIAELMEKEHVSWTHSDKSPGSRVNGLQLMRDALENSLEDENPGLYIMDHCRAFISLVPVLPRDEDNPDDVDTSAEDHCYDEARYRVLASAKTFFRAPLTIHQP
jgi:hypothetical protein